MGPVPSAIISVAKTRTSISPENWSRTMARLSTMAMAAAKPCTKRRPTRASIEPAQAHSSDEPA